MSELSFPWELFGQVGQARNQNRQNMYQDIAGLGQGLGGTLGAVAKFKQQQELKALIDKLLRPQGQTQQPVQGPQLPMPPNTMGSTGGQPMGSMAQAGPATADPVMQTVLPFVKNNPDLLQSVLPAMVKGAYQSKRPGKTGGTDYQWASLAERQKEFGERQKMQGNIQEFRQNIDQAILALRKSGMKTQADRLEAQKKEWLAQHFILGALGMGPQEEPEISGGESSSDEGWSIEPAP